MWSGSSRCAHVRGHGCGRCILPLCWNCLVGSLIFVEFSFRHRSKSTTTMGAPIPSTSDPPRSISAVSLEETYTSLIQEYLQVMCLENATFLAERLVATSKSTNALYLLAICHYRLGAPRRALMILEDVKVPDASTEYLTAKCCFELEFFGRAEEALLQRARVEFQATTEGDMDDWIVETSPCPVPNGAVGLYLLGNICRKSSRKQRAMKYYRMSLQVCVNVIGEESMLHSHLSLLSFLVGPTNVDQLPSAL